MTEQPSDLALDIWRRLVEAHMLWIKALQAFFADGVNRVALLRMALKSGDFATTFTVTEFMPTSELIELFDEWVEWAATSHKYVERAREIIKLLPREWVLSRIEATAEPILRQATYDEYRLLLGLYEELDKALTRRLAERAAEHDDPDIREAGQDYLQRLRGG